MLSPLNFSQLRRAENSAVVVASTSQNPHSLQRRMSVLDFLCFSSSTYYLSHL
jgi:hypothetical protein